MTELVQKPVSFTTNVLSKNLTGENNTKKVIVPK